MSARSSVAPPRSVARVLLFALALATALAAMSLVGVSSASTAFAGPCPGDPPPPLPQQCGDQPCPSLPSTGGGGAACEDDPSDPACQSGTIIPRTLLADFHIDARRVITMPVFAAPQATVVAHPCPADPPPAGPPGGPPAPPPGGPLGGPPPAPTPVPLIPVCAACEAPGVAAGVETPTVQVRTNPATGLVNLPTWLWAEGYRGQDLYGTRSWSPPYEPTTIEVRYSVKRYFWNFGDGGQIESRSLGQPYPAESDIRNAYGWASRTEPGGVFHFALIIEWDVEYRVNGSPPRPLPAVRRRYEAIHPVQELQPIVTGP